MVSIIIPTLNEESVIGATLESLLDVSGVDEVVVVDGGSSDRTVEIASKLLAGFKTHRVIVCNAGRGSQLNTGAEASAGDILLFLHADTALPASAIKSINSAVEQPLVIGGNFKLLCGGKEISSRIFTFLYGLRRWFGIYYGDSAIWVRRSAYDALDGFSDAPIMEDYDFCRRLERAGRTVCLEGPVVTSARRWNGRAVRTVGLWMLIQWLYLIGVSAERLAPLYYPETTRRVHS